MIYNIRLQKYYGLVYMMHLKTIIKPVLLFVTRGDDNVHFGLGLGADFKLSRAFDMRLSVGFGDVTLEGFAISAVWVH